MAAGAQTDAERKNWECSMCMHASAPDINIFKPNVEYTLSAKISGGSKNFDWRGRYVKPFFLWENYQHHLGPDLGFMTNVCAVSGEESVSTRPLELIEGGRSYDPGHNPGLDLSLAKIE